MAGHGRSPLAEQASSSRRVDFSVAPRDCRNDGFARRSFEMTDFVDAECSPRTLTRNTILKGSTSRAGRDAAAGEEVEAFLDALDHPHKAEILALRRIILGADPAIAQGIKWNAPSFRTSEWFATFHLRARAGVQVILHFGAKVRDRSGARAAIADPESILAWLADDRASATFRDLADVQAKESAFTAVIREWIRHV
jgi:hypothetical protein